jgi:hypothetical protein
VLVWSLGGVEGVREGPERWSAMAQRWRARRRRGGEAGGGGRKGGAPFIAARGGGRKAMWWRQLWVRQSGGGRGPRAVGAVGRRCSDRVPDWWVPHGFTIF